MDKANALSLNLFFIGFMGVGKSTVTELLCSRLGAELVEMDSRIEEDQGRTITQIFAQEGESYFRSLETEFLRELQKSTGYVVSCGGGIVVRPENIEIMKENGRIIWLTALPETIYERVKNSSSRPILNNNMNVAYITSLMEKRHALYERAADMVIATDKKTSDEICDEIIRLLV